MKCFIEDCSKERGSKNKYCPMHRARITRHGDPRVTKQPRHGLSRTPEFTAWDHMIQRCHNENCSVYKWYGARGIVVCDEWRDSFLNFYKDMGPRPSNGHSLERVDNSKGYSPDNCRWATKVEQMNNTRRNKFYTYNGESLSLSQWARKVSMNPRTLYARVVEYGWTIEDALTLPKSYRHTNG